MTEYGRQKAEVEAGVVKLGKGGAVVRLTKVFHPGMSLIDKWTWWIYKAGRSISAFNELLKPLFPSRGPKTVVAGIARGAEERRDGIWQLLRASDGSFRAASGIAVKLRALLNLPEARIEMGLVPEGKMEHNPAHTTLDSGRAVSELGLEFPPVDPVLESVWKSGGDLPKAVDLPGE